MPAIRWMGYAGPYLGLSSLIWEFEQDLGMEVSAEWTIKGRTFKIPSKNTGIIHGKNIQYGLLLKSSAINRRFRCDGGSGYSRLKKKIPKKWRTISLDSQLLTIKPWEALCKKQYVALIILKNYKLLCPKTILEYCKTKSIPILIYQEHYDSGVNKEVWTLTPYEIRSNENQLKSSFIDIR